MHVSLSELPGILAESVKNNMVYIHVLNRGGRGVRSPLDSVRKAVSSESGGIIRSGQSAQKWEGSFVTNKVVVARVWVGDFRLRPTRTRFYPGQPKQELGGDCLQTVRDAIVREVLGVRGKRG